MRWYLLVAVALAVVSVLTFRKYERISNIALLMAYLVLTFLFWAVIPWNG